MSTEEEPPIEVKNYTPFWNLERKIYSFYDVQLPMPVSLTVLGVFVATGIPWGLLMWLLQVPLDPPWFLLWLIVPGGLAFLGNKPIFEGKTIFQNLTSRIKHLTENRRYKRLEPDLNKYETPIVLEQNVSTDTTEISPTPYN